MYDPLTDTWTTGTPMLAPRFGLEVAVVNDELYAIGGTNEDGRLYVNEKYTPIGYIPEFPSWIILPLLIASTLVVFVMRNRLRKKGLG